MANTTNLNLVKPAGTDKALVSVLNSNSDKIDAWAGTTNQALSNQNPKRGALSASQIANDTSIMDLEPGTYQNVLGNSVMPYLPTGYGTLDVADSGVAYKAFIYTSTANDIYYRICHKTDRSWYGGWQQLALKSDIALGEYVVAGGLILRKFGKVCVLNGYYTWSSTQSGEVTIETLPAEYRPKHTVRAMANIGSNALSYGRTAYFTVEGTGTVKVVPADSGGYVAVYVNCSWVLA